MNHLFSQLGIALDIIIFLLTAFITATSYRLYRAFRKRNYLQFSTGFFLISMGYLAITILNIVTFPLMRVSDLGYLSLEGVLTLLWYLPVLAGLLILTLLYYGVDDRKLQLLLAVLLTVGFVMGGGAASAFFVFSGLLFLFIALRLFEHYRAAPDTNSLLILLGFSMLFLSKMASGALFVHEGVYVGYYLFKVGGAALIAYGMWVISR